MKQAHSATLWQEPSGSGGVPTVTPVWFIASASDFVISFSGTEIAHLVDGGSGDVLFSTNMALAPVRYMVKLSGDVIFY